MRLGPSLSLSQKGLLLVGALLLLETIFVGALSWLLFEAERQAAREAHSKAIAGHTSRILQLMYDAGHEASAYQMENAGPPAAQRFRDDVNLIPKEVAALRELVKDDARNLEMVNRIDSTLTKAIKFVRTLIEMSEAGDRLEALALAAKGKPTFVKLEQQMYDDLHLMMSEQQKIIDESPAKQTRSREILKRIIIFFFAFNVLAAISLAVLYVRHITTRIDVLIQNTDRLARNSPLAPRLPGADEIARLDHVFHDMADALAEAARLKQEFVAMVSHDLRTPLTSIQGFLTLLEDGAYGDLPTKAHERTHLANRSINRLISLINDLLDMEKMEAGKLEMNIDVTPVQPIVERSIDSVQNFAEQHQVKLESERTEFDVVADPDRIVQVLVNLLSNAIKFSPKGAPVRITTEQSDKIVEVRVIDQGPGIPAKYIDTIFERFRQLPEGAQKKGSTGLGLAICKAIIEQHGGTIGVDTEEGKGSTFWFKLPAA